jgi:hypothetical protein
MFSKASPDNSGTCRGQVNLPRLMRLPDQPVSDNPFPLLIFTGPAYKQEYYDNNG